MSREALNPSQFGIYKPQAGKQACPACGSISSPKNERGQCSNVYECLTRDPPVAATN
jgi:hypothetical protein